MLYRLPELLASWFQRIFPVFFKYESMGANDPQDMANLDLRGMVGKIYAGATKIAIYVIYKLWASGCGPHGFRVSSPFIVNGR